jgi:asparagine synthase (glutamine-hydrolysing)
MLLADASIYLPQDILVKVDRASMAQSLETRAPFLDRQVTELAFSFPVNWHRYGYKGKRMLRRSFAPILPESVWQRRKQGFSMPLHKWFRGELGNRLKDWLNEDPGPFNQKETIAFLNEHVARSRDHGSRLWQIYIYLLWRRNNAQAVHI